MQPLTSKHESAKRAAKWHKVFPDKAISSSGADYIIWIDASINIDSSRFVEYMIDQAGDTLAIFAHPFR